MPHTRNRAVLIWILAFASFAALLVVYGGFVRLTRSGLSIVEWNPVSGTVPPMTQRAWETEFSKYQRTPEFQQINSSMSLEQYKEIYSIEWIHRILARLAGLVFAIPFLIFVLNRSIPLREVGLYVLMGVLFLAQALMGWIMVSSGLGQRPFVSHYLLTAHLFLALLLVGISIWTLLGHAHGFPDRNRPREWSAASIATLAGLVVLLVQMAYGGFTAGLKAGHVSDSWPLMLGRWIPEGMLSQVKPPLLNLVEAPLTVAFIHRWLAIVALLAAILIYQFVSHSRPDAKLIALLRLLVALCALQIILGIAVVVSGVQTGLALLHQLNAIGLFATLLLLLHRLRARDGAISP